MANISDVANRANVSAMTVSRVTNNSGYVKAETRERVLRAMQELNYHPNYLARSLVEQRTHMMALIVPDITNPFYTSVARGAEDMARARGYRLILCNSDESLDKEQEYVNMCLSIRVDGLVIVSAGDESRTHLAKFQTYAIPVVLLDREVPGIEADLVTGDNVYGSSRLVEHLIAQGHRRIAMVGGGRSISTSRERLAGYRLALEEAGIAFDEDLVYETSYARSPKPAIVDALLAEANRPTAVFAGNNFVATGIILELRRRRLQVPEDIAIVCFDDIDPLSLAEPFLTVAMQPAYEEGRLATQLLLERIESDPSSATLNPRKIVMKPELLFRRSSGAPGEWKPTVVE